MEHYQSMLMLLKQGKDKLERERERKKTRREISVVRAKKDEMMKDK